MENAIGQTADGRVFEVVRQAKNNGMLIVWEKLKDNHGEHHEELKGMRITDLDAEFLKSVNLWDSLSEEVRQSIESPRRKVKEETIYAEIKPEKKKRIKRDLPKEYTCTECHKVQIIQAGAIEKRLKTLGVTLEEYTANFKCQDCFSTKGRRRNPEKPPTECVCTRCKAVNVIGFSVLEKRVNRLNIKLEDYLAKYTCQKCVCTRGRQKKNA